MPTVKSLYSLDPLIRDGGSNKYRIHKFNAEYVEQTIYNIYVDDSGKPYYCSCIATKDDCRHRQMLRLFLQNKVMGDGKFLVYDHTKGQHQWIPPLRDPTIKVGDDDGQAPDW